MFLFGLATVCQGLVQNYSGLIATRFFLGLFETGMFPGCVFEFPATRFDFFADLCVLGFYLIGMWYRRSEAQKRYTFFFSSTTLAGAFGGLLASAIGKMNGMRGYRGWRWIFILEGVLTCVVSIFFFFLLPNFPENSKWLTKEEREYVQARLHADQGHSAAERNITARDVVNVFKDIKVVIGGLMYFGLIVPAYGFAVSMIGYFFGSHEILGKIDVFQYFAPGIIQSYGYSPIQTQLHSVPPWAAAFVFAMLIAWISDRARHRFLFAVFSLLVAVSGFAILISVHNHRNVQYGALFLVAMGAYTAMPVIVCCKSHQTRFSALTPVC